MDKCGIVIFSDGSVLTFGKMSYVDQKDYLTAPGHEESFIKEIVSSMHFKLSGIEYDDNETLYKNIPNLAFNGLIIILNNKTLSTDKERIISQLGPALTEDQVYSLNGLEDIINIQEQATIEYLSDTIDDYREYDNLKQYLEYRKKIR